MKSGYCTIIQNRRDHGMSKMNYHQPRQRQVFIQRRCYIYGGTRRESSIMSSFQKSQTINSNKYCSQLDQLKAAVDGKCPELVNRKCIILHNARLHVSLMTRQNLFQLDWEILIYLPYSPDIVPLDVHLFQSLQDFLHGKNFSSLKDC